MFLLFNAKFGARSTKLVTEEHKFFTYLHEKSHNNQNAPLDSKNYCSLEVTTLISMLGSDEAYKLSVACSTVLGCSQPKF